MPDPKPVAERATNVIDLLFDPDRVDDHDIGTVSGQLRRQCVRHPLAIRVAVEALASLLKIFPLAIYAGRQ